MVIKNRNNLRIQYSVEVDFIATFDRDRYVN